MMIGAVCSLIRASELSKSFISNESEGLVDTAFTKSAIVKTRAVPEGMSEVIVIQVSLLRVEQVKEAGRLVTPTHVGVVGGLIDDGDLIKITSPAIRAVAGVILN